MAVTRDTLDPMTGVALAETPAGTTEVVTAEALVAGMGILMV